MRALILEDDRVIARDIYEIACSLEFEARFVHNFEQALTTLSEFEPDLILCDINLGAGQTGIHFIEAARTRIPKLEVIFITAHFDRKTLEKVTALKPLHFIVKPYNKDQVITSLNLARVKTEFEQDDQVEGLTAKELQIVKLIADKHTSREISEILFISEKTVRNHRYNITKKLHLPDRQNSLLSWAVEHLK